MYFTVLSSYYICASLPDTIYLNSFKTDNVIMFTTCYVTIATSIAVASYFLK